MSQHLFENVMCIICDICVQIIEIVSLPTLFQVTTWLPSRSDPFTIELCCAWHSVSFSENYRNHDCLRAENAGNQQNPYLSRSQPVFWGSPPKKQILHNLYLSRREPVFIP